MKKYKEVFAINKQNNLNNLYTKQAAACKDAGITQAIIKGAGSINSNVCFVYENEKSYGDFVNVINDLNLSINDVYATCLIKIRRESDVSKYKFITELLAPFLFEEVKIINPKICVTIGSSALAALTSDKTIKLKKMHGKILEFSNLTIFPIYNKKSTYYSDISQIYKNDINNLKSLLLPIIKEIY